MEVVEGVVYSLLLELVNKVSSTFCFLANEVTASLENADAADEIPGKVQNALKACLLIKKRGHSSPLNA